jgi:transcriptional regulator with XRE-family HTH domain
MDFSERIKQYRKEKGLTQKELADIIGVKHTALSNWETNIAKPDIDTIIKLSNYFGISIDNLVLGVESNKIIAQNIIQEQQADYNLAPDNKSYIPITDINAAAGSGWFNGDNITTIDKICLPNNLLRGGTYLAVRIKGDSMSPTLQDGGFLIIRLLDRTEWAHMPNEHVYVVSDREGKTFAKRLKNRYQKGFYVLMSDNPDKASYPNFNFQLEDINSIWHAEWYLSARMPNIHDQYYSRLQRLEDIIEDIQRKIT